MEMMGGGLCNEVIGYVRDWIPERSYRSETKFQNDLQDYLDQRLNEFGGMGLEMGMGGGEKLPVKREHGSVNADVAVGDKIGIEIKRDFTNTQKHRLSGQIKDYQKEFPCVIVVACGISDMDGWRELQNDYGGMGGFGVQQSEIEFVHKPAENFGKSPDRLQGGDDSIFGGDTLDGGLF